VDAVLHIAQEDSVAPVPKINWTLIPQNSTVHLLKPAPAATMIAANKGVPQYVG
jgi:hypothetical protein